MQTGSGSNLKRSEEAGLILNFCTIQPEHGGLGPGSSLTLNLNTAHHGKREELLSGHYSLRATQNNFLWLVTLVFLIQNQIGRSTTSAYGDHSMEARSSVQYVTCI
jgi:hypothetical protein